jgi:hypothetical protein
MIFSYQRFQLEILFFNIVKKSKKRQCKPLKPPIIWHDVTRPFFPVRALVVSLVIMMQTTEAARSCTVHEYSWLI